MAYHNLWEFINQLEKEGQLVRVKKEVSRDLEITEITDRISKAFGPALLFERVKDCPYPVFINGFGSMERMAKALSAESLWEIQERIGKLLDVSRLGSLKGFLEYGIQLTSLLHAIPLRKPVTLKRPPCQQVIERKPDLNTLPVLKCWPLDGGRFLTLPLVITRHPGGMAQNMGMYRMQVIDRNTTAMHWHKHKDGAGIYNAYKKAGKRMPVSVALGPDPAVTYGATAPLPPFVSEVLLAGFLRKKAVRMVKSITNSIYVPEEAQFVLEGYVETREDLFLEGPFGDHTGYYSLPDYYPRFHVTCITHQKNPVYPATIVGKPPMEDCYMAKATERLFLPFLKLLMPQLVNLNLPLEGVFHNCAIVSIKNTYKGAAQTIMNQIWGLGQMRYTKLIVVVGESVDPYKIEEVWDAVLTHTDFSRDLVLSKGPLDALDHSSNEALFGTRVGVDAVGNRKTMKRKGSLRCVAVKKRQPGDGKKAAKAALNQYGEKLVLVVDEKEDVTDQKTIMWRVFNNIDGSRDFVCQNDRLAVDATKKMAGEGIRRPWPEDIAMSREIINKVDEKWMELEKYWKK